MRETDSRLVEFIIFYVNIVRRVTDSIFGPLSGIVQPYSDSLAETFMILSRVTSNLLILAPILAISLVAGVAVFGFGSTEQYQDANLRTVISILMLFASLFAFTAMNIYEKSLMQKFYISILLAAGGVSVMYFSTPELYAVLFGIFYGVGGYVSSYITHENPLPHAHIYENLEPHKTISRISTLSLVLIVGTYGAAEVFLTEFLDEQSLLFVGSLLPIVGFLTTTLQYSPYKQIYKHAGLNTKSPIWILTPRLLIILGTGLALSNMAITPISLLMFASPGIFGLMFTYYIVGQTEEVLGDKTFTDSNMLSNPVMVTGNQNAEVSATTNKDNETAELQFNLSIEISEDIPDKQANPWMESVAVSDDLLDALSTLGRVDGDKQEELREFKYDALEVAMEKYSEESEEIDISKLPNELAQDIIEMRVRNDDINLQGIQDTEIKMDNQKTTEEDDMYADLF